MATAKRSQPRRFWLSRSCAPRPMPVGAGPVVPRDYLDLHYRFDAAVHLPQERRRLEVAADPDTPIEELVPLLELFPDAVLRNPAWQVAQVADPSLVGSLWPEQMAAIAGSPAAEPEVLVQLALLAAIPREWMRKVRLPLAIRGDAPRRVLEILTGAWSKQLFGDPAVVIARRRLRSMDETGCSLGGWRDVLASAIRDELWLLSHVKHCQRSRFVGGLLRSGSLRADAPVVSVAALLGRRPTRDEVHSALSGGPAHSLRPSPAEVNAVCRRADSLAWLCLLSSDCCPEPLLAAAAESGSWWHRMCAAENPRLTPARRRRLADDPHWIVRGAARERMGA